MEKCKQFVESKYTKGDKINTYIDAGDSKIAILGASKDEVQT